LDKIEEARKQKEMTVAEASHLFGGRSVQKEGASTRSLRLAVYPEEGPSRRSLRKAIHPEESPSRRKPHPAEGSRIKGRKG
jgi:hypothetical protein